MHQDCDDENARKGYLFHQFIVPIDAGHVQKHFSTKIMFIRQIQLEQSTFESGVRFKLPVLEDTVYRNLNYFILFPQKYPLFLPL